MVIGMLASYRYLFDVHPSRVQEDREQALDDFRTGNSYSALVDIYDSQSFSVMLAPTLVKVCSSQSCTLTFNHKVFLFSFFFSMA